MKLAAIYNVWDGLEHLRGSIQSIREHVDTVIIVWQQVSNWGEGNPEIRDFIAQLYDEKLCDTEVRYEPTANASTRNAINHETSKRQTGVYKAVAHGCTHFLHIDADEYYDTKRFGELKHELRGIRGMSTIKIQNYYKRPTLKLSELDTTVAPFISSVIGAHGGSGMPAHLKGKIDFTRCTHSVEAVAIDPGGDKRYVMHHMSYVRKGGIEKKLRNSTARKNIFREEIIREYEQAEAGYVLKEIFTGNTLIACTNKFNIDFNE